MGLPNVSLAFRQKHLTRGWVWVQRVQEGVFTWYFAFKVVDLEEVVDLRIGEWAWGLRLPEWSQLDHWTLL